MEQYLLTKEEAEKLSYTELFDEWFVATSLMSEEEDAVAADLLKEYIKMLDVIRAEKLKERVVENDDDWGDEFYDWYNDGGGFSNFEYQPKESRLLSSISEYLQANP